MTSRSSVLRVSVLGDASDLARAFKSAEKSAETFGEKSKRWGQAITTRITLPLAGAAVGLVGLAQAQEDAERKMSSTFESMGAAAWTSKDKILDHASALQDVSTFGDEAILGLQDLLLTFGNVKDGVGPANQIFSDATRIGLDMSAALGQDLKTSAIQLGKALNDPVAGISALSRVGITFTEDQKKVIKSLAETGDTAGAQRIILNELEKQFGGTAKAMSETAAGSMKQAMNQLGDIGEVIGAEISKVAATAIPNLIEGISVVKDWFDGLPGLAKGAAAAIGGVTLALAAIAAHPVVAGLAGVAALLHEIGRAAREEKDAIVDFKGIIEETGGASADTALQLLEARDATGEMAVLAAEAGLTLKDLALAIDGDERALSDMETALKDATREGKLHELQAQAIRNAVDVLGTAMLEAEADIKKVEEAERKQREESDRLETELGELETATGEVETATDDAKTALMEYADEQRKAVDPAFNLKSAVDDYRTALDEVRTMQRDGKTDSDEYKDAVLRLYDAQGNLNYAQAAFDTADMRTDLQELGTQLGFSEDDVEDLISWLERLDRTTARPEIYVGATYDPNVPRTPAGGPPKFVPMQTGGIVPGPPGAAVPLMAHGGEVVLNKKQQKALLSGGTSAGYEIHIHAGSIVTETELEDVIIRVMSKFGLRNGNR